MTALFPSEAQQGAALHDFEPVKAGHPHGVVGFLAQDVAAEAGTLAMRINPAPDLRLVTERAHHRVVLLAGNLLQLDLARARSTSGVYLADAPGVGSVVDAFSPGGRTGST